MSSDRTFTLAPRLRNFIVAFTVLPAVVGPLAVNSFLTNRKAAEGLILVVWLSILLPGLYWLWFLLPWRISINEHGVVFIARQRRVEAPWEALRDIRSSWYDVNRLWFKWSWSDGAIVTSSAYDGFYELIHEVVERAPQVRIAGA